MILIVFIDNNISYIIISDSNKNNRYHNDYRLIVSYTYDGNKRLSPTFLLSGKNERNPQGVRLLLT